MNTFRPFGVTFTPKPGSAASQYTASQRAVGNASMVLFVNFVRGIHESSRPSCYFSFK
jgi:hypothetical protein